MLIFVSSRRQTRLTALDLIAFLAAEDDPKQWLHMPEMEVSYFPTGIRCYHIFLLQIPQIVDSKNNSCYSCITVNML